MNLFLHWVALFAFLIFAYVFYDKAFKYQKDLRIKWSFLTIFLLIAFKLLNVIGYLQPNSATSKFIVTISDIVSIAGIISLIITLFLIVVNPKKWQKL